MSLKWFYVDWGNDIKGYAIEFRDVMGVKQQRHNWLHQDGSIVTDEWIKAIK